MLWQLWQGWGSRGALSGATLGVVGSLVRRRVPSVPSAADRVTFPPGRLAVLSLARRSQLRLAPLTPPT